MAEKRIIELEVKTNSKSVASDMKVVTDATKEATDSVEGLGEASEEAGGKTKVFNDINNIVKKMVPGFKAAEGGVNSFGSSLKALMMNPIVLLITAIVGALAALFKAFSSTKAGGEQLEQFMSGLGAIMDVIRDRILAAGEAIVKFFSGDLKGALDSAKKAISGFGDEVSNEFKKAANATKQLQVANDEFRKLSVSRAKLNRDLAKTKEVITDENASLEEKRQAIEKVRIAEERQTKAELENAAKKLKAIKAKNALSDTSREDLDKEAQAEAELYRLQEESARNIRTFNKQERLLRKQEQAERKEQQKERLDKLKEEQKAREESLKKIKDAEKEYQNSLLTQQQRELNDATNKYDELIKLAIKNKQDTAILEEAKQKAISDINSKYAKLELEKKAKLEAAKKALEAKQLADMKSADEAAWNEEKARMDLRAKYIEDDQTREIQERENTYQKELVDLQNAYDNKLLTDEEYQNTVKLATEKNNQDKIEIEKKYLDKSKQIQQQRIDLVLKYAQTFTNVMSSLTGALNAQDQERLKNVKKGSAEELAIKKRMFERDKKMRIAQTIIDTASNVIQSVRNGGGIPTGIPFGVAAGVQGAIQLATIAKTKFEGAGGGGGDQPVPTVAGGGAVAPNFNIVGNAQAQNPLAGLGQQPIKAYVVSGEVTTAQSLDRQKVYSATFG